MKTLLVVCGCVFGFVLFCGFIGVMWVLSIFNTEVSLSNRYDAQFNVVETTIDNMRKTLMNQFSVNKKFADDFIAVVQKQSVGRQGGGLLKMSTESAALGIAPELYGKMMNSIEGKLAEFKRAQDVLTDVWREHKTFCEVFPNRFLIGGKIKAKPEMISSDIVKEAMVTKKLKDNVLE